ncbi:uncharacterized protein LOC127266065 [Andrographis paniculata]|uniref:uncharacterized protein LOC127266065 n=1 Tax=Andrographis paniculata TaxID=175694 RepID=UPI0021E78F3A|nr:uncharacterized protein LOC127266065 [Andrographis paniculata]
MTFRGPTNKMFSFKVMLISTSVLSAAIMLKLSVPAITDFAVYEVPSIYNGVVSWLRPPYLYLLINCIIITIVASSKIQLRKDDSSATPTQAMAADSVHPLPVPLLSAKNVETEYHTYDSGVQSDSCVYQLDVQKRLDLDAYERVEARAGAENEQSAFVVRAADGGAAFAEDAMSNKENEYVFSKSSANTARNENIPAEYSPSKVKPPVSARFVHRRNVKASPEGGKTVLGVSKPKRNDTLESTWKAITDGRPIPLTRHLKKSDTWEREHVVRRQEKTMGKAATFSAAAGSPSPPGKLRREASLSQDELNRRVEAFIKKFNEEMRLQRQESLNQYKQMINR